MTFHRPEFLPRRLVEILKKSIAETLMQNSLSLNLAYLQAHLIRIDLLLRFAIERARAAGFDPANEFQGLYISDEEISKHLSLLPGAGLWDRAAPAEAANAQLQQHYERSLDRLSELEAKAVRAGTPLRLLHLCDTLNLSEEDLDLFLACLAPALDRRYERIYGFLQDDVTKRQPTVNVVLNLFGQDWERRVRLLEHLTDGAPLIRHSIIIPFTDAAGQHAPFISYFLKVDSRIANYVQGIDHIPAQWQHIVRPVAEAASSLDSLVLNPALRQGLRQANQQPAPIFYFYGGYGSGKRAIANALASEQGRALLEVDLQALRQTGLEIGNLALMQAFRFAVREGLLRGVVLLLSRWESILDENQDPPRWLWEEILVYPHLVVLSGREAWEPRGPQRQRPILRLELGVPTFDERLLHWQQHLNGSELDTSELAYKFKLTGGQIRDAASMAYDLAAWRGETQPTLEDLYSASRAQSNRKLTDLAVKIMPRFSWEHIVLPSDRIRQLHEMCDQLRYAVRVYEEWGFGGRIANSRGLSALFAGQSGTGKTMAAEIIAKELGLELYKIDLAGVVSKYIGETEKNLAKVFEAAEHSGAILFFDEADALFGKRSEVKDSHDRYANIEIGYLLQRMESYDGIAVLATNLRQNLDEAFTRRLDFLVDFPFPEEDDRLKIWQVSFPPDAPLGSDVDLPLLARRYRMAGGNIRNAAIASAFLAAADGSAHIRMPHLLHAIRREHQKMGKLLEDAPQQN
jgi:AAA+ superfamily predicted ATPase